MSRTVTLAAVAVALIAPMAVAASVSAPSQTLAAGSGTPSGDVCNSAAPTGDVWHGSVIADIQSAACPGTDGALNTEMRRKTSGIYAPHTVMGFSNHP
jgi:hypothetical protein